IRATYCVPRKPNRKNALQIVVNGITYEKNIWAGYGFGSQYNWYFQANARGYAALALDRPGHGANPARPDPLRVIQPQLNVEIFRVIIRAAYGHSYGSSLGLMLAEQDPTAVDAYVLTGVSSAQNPAPVRDGTWLPAALFDPIRFQGVPLGYIVLVNQTQRTLAMYASGFDPAIAAYDFATQDTISNGEAGALVTKPATKYTRSLLVVTGDKDIFYCSPPMTAAQCEAILVKTRVDGDRIYWFEINKDLLNTILNGDL
ncbi:hypothetical protein B0H63DRAFT_533673, partial [Podospora didyma]